MRSYRIIRAFRYARRSRIKLHKHCAQSFIEQPAAMVLTPVILIVIVTGVAGLVGMGFSAKVGTMRTIHMVDTCSRETISLDKLIKKPKIASAKSTGETAFSRGGDRADHMETELRLRERSSTKRIRLSDAASALPAQSSKTSL